MVRDRDETSCGRKGHGPLSYTPEVLVPSVGLSVTINNVYGVSMSRDTDTCEPSPWSTCSGRSING